MARSWLLVYMVVLCSLVAHSSGVTHKCTDYSTCYVCVGGRSSCEWCEDGDNSFCAPANQHRACSGKTLDRSDGSSKCKPEESDVFALWGFSVGWVALFVILAYFRYRNGKASVALSVTTATEGDTACSECHHDHHHVGNTCMTSIPNTHDTCQCAGECFTGTNPSHCGRVCGNKWTSGQGKSRRDHVCECNECTCSKCAPTIDCGCNDCTCTECVEKKVWHSLDRGWWWWRAPLVPIGFGILVWSAVIGWTNGIIWGVVHLVVVPFLRRRSFCCGPRTDYKTTESKWHLWDKAENLSIGKLLAYAPPTLGDLSHGEGEGQEGEGYAANAPPAHLVLATLPDRAPAFAAMLSNINNKNHNNHINHSTAAGDTASSAASAPFLPPEQIQQRCYKCDALVPRHNTFCGQCGAPVNSHQLTLDNNMQ